MESINHSTPLKRFEWQPWWLNCHDQGMRIHQDLLLVLFFCCCCWQIKVDVITAVIETSWFDITLWTMTPSKICGSLEIGRAGCAERFWGGTLHWQIMKLSCAWCKMDLTAAIEDPMKDDIRISRGLVPDNGLEMLSFPGNCPSLGGRSSPTSRSSTMMVAPVQLLVGA